MAICYATTIKTATGNNGEMYYLEADNQRIVKIDKTGKLLASYGGKGALSYPQGLALDGSGNIFIADTGNKRVIHLKDEGASFQVIKTLPKPTENWQPTALDLNGLALYITDSLNQKVWIFKPDDSYSQIGIGTKGVSALGASNKIYKNYGMATDLSGNVYIINTFQNSVQKYSPQGRLIMDYGVRGRGEVCFIYPKDIVIDLNDNMYIADTGNDRVQKTDKMGRFKGFYGVDENKNGKIFRPCGLNISNDGYLYVTSGKGEVLKYKIAVNLSEIRLINPIFSPNGDGRKDALSFAFKMDEPAKVTCRVIDPLSRVEIRNILSGVNMSAGEHRLAWDGKKNNGENAPDGEYLLTISAISNDGARESFPSRHRITIDTAPPTAYGLALIDTLISPDNNGFRDNIRLSYRTSEDGYSVIQIVSAVGEKIIDSLPVKAISKEVVNEDIWPGSREASGVPDGRYKCKLLLKDEAGNEAEYYQEFDVDLTPPVFNSLITSNLSFSPNGDGKKDSVNISFEVSEYVNCLSGEVIGASDADGTLKMLSIEASGSQYVAIWDGTGKNGIVLPDNSYRLKLTAQDRAGNYGVAF